MDVSPLLLSHNMVSEPVGNPASSPKIRPFIGEHGTPIQTAAFDYFGLMDRLTCTVTSALPSRSHDAQTRQTDPGCQRCQG